MEKDFEIALIVPYVSQRIQEVEQFLKDVKREHKPPVLKSMNLYCWSSSDSLGIIFSFDFPSFLPRYVNTIKKWGRKNNARIFELMAFGEHERKEFKNKFILTSDLKFIGDFEVSFALASILRRTSATRGRKDQRYRATLKVGFRSPEHFIQEYTKDISKGGIFIATDKPLPVGSRVELVLSLPGSVREVKVSGEIVHVVNGEQAGRAGFDRAAGMGVQFTEFEQGGQQLLDAYVGSLQKKSHALLHPSVPREE